MIDSGFQAALDYAREADAEDELAPLRDAFMIPAEGGRPLRYLCGHSLGLMPRAARSAVETELERWASRGVEGHFGDDGGWFAYHERFAEPLARLTGALPGEVVAMNSLTTNLHLMLVSFFCPAGRRRKIVIERGAFPSDRYAVESQLRFHGLDPERDLLELEPDSERRTRPAALEALLAARGEEVALVLLPGVQFLTGEALDLAGFVRVAARYEVRIGFDLAHAIGNLPTELHDSGADFAVWCSYKYLNAGPGAIGGCFVHERWHGSAELPRFAGWWGHDKTRRFAVQDRFRALPSAEAWQLSNPPVLAMAPLIASLDLFERAGTARLRQKSLRLTAFLRQLVAEHLRERAGIVTPEDDASHGAQLSLELALPAGDGRRLIGALRARGVVADWREPNLLRLAPVPLYNSYEDAVEAVRALDGVMSS